MNILDIILQSTASVTQGVPQHPPYIQCLVADRTSFNRENQANWDTLKEYFESLGNGALNQSESIVIPQETEKKINQVFGQLNYKSDSGKNMANELIKEMLSMGVSNFQLSTTGEGEFLIYTRSSDGSFRNVLIDENADIEIIFLPRDRTKTKNKYFFKEDGISLPGVIAALNGMR